MKKILSMFVILMLGSAMASFAGGEKEEAAAGGLKPISIGLAMNQMDAVVFHAFSDYLKIAATEEAKRRGYDLKYSFINANGDVTKQANDIKDLISKGCEVIFCSALDSKTILSSIAEVHNAGKYFVMFFREADESAIGNQVPSATVNMDSEHQAYGAMVETFKIMAADGVEPKEIIDVHGDIADENAQNREKGFRKAVKEFGWEDRVAQVVDTGHWEPEAALQNTAAALQAHPDSNCMYVSSDWLMSGVQTALENAGKWNPRGESGHVYLGGTDMYPSGIKYTIDKYMDGNVDVPAWQISEKCAEVAFDLIEGKEVTKENILMKGTVINSDNAAEVVASTSHLWGVDYADQE